MNELATLVILAYDQFETFKSGQPWGLPGEYQLITELYAKPEGLFSKHEPFGFIVRKGNTLKIIYRGTDSWGDWLTDGNLSQVEHRLGMVHEGGFNLYAQMAEDIQSAVSNNPGCTIEIAAHSLGCWPAAFTAADLFERKLTPILYAAPRPGNAEFAANLNSLVPNIIRVVNTEDIVPTLPLPVCGDRVYCHVGSPVCFTFNGGSIADNHSMSLYQERGS
jgi:triacylglycerol lipase